MSTRFAAATALGLVLSLTPAFAQQSNTSSASTGAKVDTVPAQQQDQMLADNMIGSAVYNTQNEDIGNINNLVVDRDGKVDAVVVGVGGFLGIGERNVAIPYGEVKIMHRAEYDRMYGNRGSNGTNNATGTSSGTTGAAQNTTGGATAGSMAGANNANTDRDLRFVVDASKDQLKNMPAFTTLTDRNRNNAANNSGNRTTTGSTGTMGATSATGVPPTPPATQPNTPAGSNTTR